MTVAVKPEPQLVFTSERDGKEVHEYVLDGQPIPSVSFIIKPCVDYNGIRKEVLENAREFGRDVDLACQFFDEQDLDEDTLDDRVRKRLNGWIKFVKEFEFKPTDIAVPRFHVHHGMPYAGTPDRFGISVIGRTLIDLKNTAESEEHHELQMAGYEAFFNDDGKMPIRKLIVRLLDDDYKVTECKDRSARRVFLDCLLPLAHWKLNRGIKS